MLIYKVLRARRMGGARRRRREPRRPGRPRRRLRALLDRRAARRHARPPLRRRDRPAPRRARRRCGRPGAELGAVARRRALPAPLPAARRADILWARPLADGPTAVPRGTRMSLGERLALPLLRRLDPETAHRLALAALRAGLGPARAPVTSPRLRTRLAGLELANPLGLAAGFDKNAEAVGALVAAGFGFVEVGAATPLPQPGNPRPRLFRLPEDRGGHQPLRLQQRRRRGDRRPPRGAAAGRRRRAEPRRQQDEPRPRRGLRRRCWPRPAAHRLRHRQRLLAQHRAAARPAGRRRARRAARRRHRRQPGPRPAGAAVPEDRARSRRRRARRDRRGRARGRHRRHRRHQHHPRPRRPREPTRRARPAASPARRSSPARPRCSRASTR